MKKRILSILLTLCMVLMFVPQTVFAEGETSSTPSVSAYATKAQLMDHTFAPDSSGNAMNIGKLVFGKNSSGESQQWYILGKDTGVSGDNTIIFAASPIASGQVFNSNTSDKIYNYEAGTGYGDSAGSTTVFANHYGASDLRVALKGMETSNFTQAEQDMMNYTTVTTNDTRNSTTYTTTDKLYALTADGDWGSKTIKAGSNDDKVLLLSKYLYSTICYWLRSPKSNDSGEALYVNEAYRQASYADVNINGGVERYVRPASNLKLSSVLFASAATVASPDTASGTIADGTAMTLRFDGTDKNIGTVKYNTTTGEIKAVKGSTSETVALVVQGNDGANDWYYSKKIDTSKAVNTSDIKSALGLSSNINLSTCKIWLEITDTDGLIYAVGATGILSSVAITDIETPAVNTTLDISASCATEGVSSTTPQITWTPGDTTAGYNTSYTASITLTADTGYEFTDSTTATVSGNAATSVNKNADGTLTVTYTFPEIPDTVDPVISGVEDGKTYCSAQTVTVSDNDAIKEVTVNGTKVTLDEYNQFTLSPASGEQKIIATDKAGNKKEVTVTVNNGHTYGAWQSNGDGTHIRYCTVDGCSGYEDGECTGGTATCTAKAECEYCGEEYGELDSSNHDLVNTPAKDATVTETGNKEYWQCENCKKYFADEKGTNEISLEDTVIQKLPPEIIKGKGQSVAEGEKKALSFTSNAAYSDFIRVELDGKTLDAKNYTVKEGSTVVTLNAGYVSTLPAGEHTIGIVSESGTASTTFTVNAKASSTDSQQTGTSNTDSPQTGDNSPMALWIALFFVSGGLMTVMGIYGKKKKYNG